MKAISIRQPWAWCIVYGGKHLENRTWRTSYRGPILIHAAKGMTRAEYRHVEQFMADILTRPLPPMEELERGGIIGSALLTDVLEESVSRWFTGPYGFLLDNRTPLPFRPMPGKLGLFDVV